MVPETRIFVAGHRGLAGRAIVRELQGRGYRSLITATHDELDLEDMPATLRFFDSARPQVVFLAAAKVGGILANDAYPVDFLIRNLQIEVNVLRASYRVGVDRLVYLGSSCMYPRDCEQPMREAHLLTGPLEPTNQPYAVAKIAGVEMCHAFNRQFGTRYLAATPAGLYGAGDNYDPETSHVLPALIRKIHDAKVEGKQEVVLWGTGRPRREFMHCEDMARAVAFLAELDNERFDTVFDPSKPPLINVGTGTDQSIRELAEIIAEVIGYGGRFVQDTSKPDGTPRKLLDVSKLRSLGWEPKIGLREGIADAYWDFIRRFESISPGETQS